MSALRDYLKSNSNNYRAVGLSADWSVEAWQVAENTVLICDDYEQWMFVCYADNAETGERWTESDPLPPMRTARILSTLMRLKACNWAADDCSDATASDLIDRNGLAFIAERELQDTGTCTVDTLELL
jgi:hypothetical protein